MTFVVTSNCDGCRFTDCVAVCPVEKRRKDWDFCERRGLRTTPCSRARRPNIDEDAAFA